MAERGGGERGAARSGINFHSGGLKQGKVIGFRSLQNAARQTSPLSREKPVKVLSIYRPSLFSIFFLYFFCVCVFFSPTVSSPLTRSSILFYPFAVIRWSYRAERNKEMKVGWTKLEKQNCRLNERLSEVIKRGRKLSDCFWCVNSERKCVRFYTESTSNSIEYFKAMMQYSVWNDLKYCALSQNSRKHINEWCSKFECNSWD